MPEMTLEKLFRSRTSGNLSDKWRHYLQMYDIWLARYKQKAISLLEIGVQNGGSLEIWATYFPCAEHIVGIDVDNACANIKFEDENIKVIIGSAATSDTQSRISDACSAYDIVIDDGSHSSEDIIRTFVGLFSKVREGGLYIVEDIHASYWAEWGGGLYHPFSSMAFFKRIADAINEKHWLCEVSTSGAFAGFEEEYGIDILSVPMDHIQSITFTNSMCAIVKAPPGQTCLGERLCSGAKQDVVVFGQFEPPSQMTNLWSSAKASPDKASST